jgi:hypothetical protein
MRDRRTAQAPQTSDRSAGSGSPAGADVDEIVSAARAPHQPRNTAPMVETGISSRRAMRGPLRRGRRPGRASSAGLGGPARRPPGAAPTPQAAAYLRGSTVPSSPGRPQRGRLLRRPGRAARRACVRSDQPGIPPARLAAHARGRPRCHRGRRRRGQGCLAGAGYGRPAGGRVDLRRQTILSTERALSRITHPSPRRCR